VITAGQDAESAFLPAWIATRLQRASFSLQDDYARRSTDSIHVIAEYSPHFIQSNLGQPDLVVKAIREVVLAARAGRDLQGMPRALPTACGNVRRLVGLCYSR
jgi:hypothetical protein